MSSRCSAIAKEAAAVGETMPCRSDRAVSVPRADEAGMPTHVSILERSTGLRGEKKTDASEFESSLWIGKKLKYRSVMRSKDWISNWVSTSSEDHDQSQYLVPIRRRSCMLCTVAL